MKKNQLYWVLQFAGWGGLMLTNYLAMAFMLPAVPLLLANFVTMLLGIGCSHLYRGYVKKKKWVDLKIVKLIPKVFFASFIQGIITAILSFGAIIIAFTFYIKANPDVLQSILDLANMSGADEEQMNVMTMQRFTLSVVIGMAASFISQYSIFFISWSALYFAYQFLLKNRKVEIEKWKLQASVKDAELSALKSQINPHFIFNSLNNIRSLVIEDSEKARDMITHLSDLLRFSVQFDQFEKVTLEKEMEVVEDYLLLESIQLEERLNYRIQLQDESSEISLPPMIIQTLVENAIKHSINDLPKGGEIVIESEVKDTYLNIFVKNTGQIKDKSSGRKGIGITNSRERLRLLYGEKASLAVENMNEKIVCATIKIPLS
jgi:signal transduction histidine kinase